MGKSHDGCRSYMYHISLIYIKLIIPVCPLGLFLEQKISNRNIVIKRGISDHDDHTLDKGFRNYVESSVDEDFDFIIP